MNKFIVKAGVALAVLSAAIGTALAHGDVTPQAINTEGLKPLGKEWETVNPYRGTARAISDDAEPRAKGSREFCRNICEVAALADVCVEWGPFGDAERARSYYNRALSSGLDAARGRIASLTTTQN